jgi:hypothetical protein
MPRWTHLILLTFTIPGCDSGSTPTVAQKAEAEEAEKAAELKARLEKRAAEREAKEEAEKKAEKDRVAGVAAVAVIPEGAKLPKKLAQACDQVGEAQTNFMKKFHSDVPEDAVFTQVGLIKKQCNGLKNVEVAMCWKYALDATTEELKGSINDYLKLCLEKYGQDAG